jgi:hypothetical protein
MRLPGSGDVLIQSSTHLNPELGDAPANTSQLKAEGIYALGCLGIFLSRESTHVRIIRLWWMNTDKRQQLSIPSNQTIL